MSYERSNIRKLAAYVPGEQPKVSKLIKLNTNENPYPPVPAVMKAIADVQGDHLRRYPSPTAQGFREAAARVHHVEPEQVIATNGSDELLRLVMTVYCEPSGMRTNQPGGIGVTNPTYSLYSVLADIQDTPEIVVDLDDDYGMPSDLSDRWNAAGCKLGFIVNPHAPSGRFYELHEIRKVAEKFDGVLIVDEAYVDFAEHDALELVRQQPDGLGLENVLVTRTLSKGYSLAGLRFGYGIGSHKIIAALDKARDSYNTDILSQAAATTAIEARDAVAESWEKVILERDRMRDELEKRGYKVFPSAANFLLTVPPKGRVGAAKIYQSLADKGIYVRYFTHDNMCDKLRITVGTPEQNDALYNALDQIK
ncbi:histidinol-phosphate transaminase [Poriferisphaera sp. WC338]|uniref:histidinol-phosphate transaminase n=1 Tax=Poriferisphaera sp. WC338 TaxID=3425129 RepID=UPI003D8167BF